MTLNAMIEYVRDALNEVSASVYHYRKANHAAPPFIVWQEQSESSAMHRDNAKDEQEIYGTVDLFTLQEYDTLIDDVQTALNSARRIGYRLNSVSYEDETNLIHYEWEFWVH